MQFSHQQIRQYLRESEFEDLFIDELGWDNYTDTLHVTVDETDYALTAIAQKRGMVVFECPTPEVDRSLPDYATRRKIQKQVAKSSHENFIIYTNADKSTQIWQWVKRQQGKPDACREHRYDHGQFGDSLIQKLQTIAFSLDEEEELTLFGVTERVGTAFYAERVTKKFYDRFKKEHDAFLKFLKGIPDEEMQRWYVSVMLNRLMFIYFIQKKGFLNDDINYLHTKFTETQQSGSNQYYKEFLCPLFFEGFAKPEDQRTHEMKRLLGKIPYLNGGIFQKHQLETLHGENIEIPDTAFEKLFNFFEQYQWHLDDRQLRNDNEINPDVLGYIFEKYINQKQMGAYYTKEDITGYISKNTIIPFLFDAARNSCKIAFEGDASVWKLLQEDPDRYIYEAVKKGVEKELPSNIAAGIDDVSTRTEWNERAPEGVDEIALPTEIWREVIARRQRYESIRSKLANGEIDSINDLITHNLNIRQFAQDVIENCEGPELLRAFWKAITEVTVLDPTCGSGAFLFAALNILEPLYEACLDRMQVFLDELQHSDKKPHALKYNDFRETLDRIAQHPNRDYFVLKSIIINNLYGVDIMDEAIEICKLRLFLKMVAQLDDVRRIEPLPDIDFNIQAGNTLVGFTTYDEVEKAVTERLDSHYSNTMDRIEEKAMNVKSLYDNFRDQQTTYGGEVTLVDKQNLQNRLKSLEDELNEYLAFIYGVDPNNLDDFEKWKKSHKPFHWFIAFYGIIQDGGFDVIIGNPPYVEYSKAKKDYKVLGYETEKCGNLYAFVSERSLKLLNNYGGFGFIIPISLVGTQRMETMQKILIRSSKSVWLSNFAERPSKLFAGADVLLTILLSRSGRKNKCTLATTEFMKWTSDARTHLFSLIAYHSAVEKVKPHVIPKLCSNTEASILAKLFFHTGNLQTHLLKRSSSPIYYRTSGGRYWKIFTNFQPRFVSNGKESISSKENHLYFEETKERDIGISVLSSSLFYWYYILTTNCRDLAPSVLYEFPINLTQLSTRHANELESLCKKLMADYKENSQLKEKISSRTGQIIYQEFYPRLSKCVIDDIDRVLAQHYGFTDEELDFIINYDIKYRMGLGK